MELLHDMVTVSGGVRLRMTRTPRTSSRSNVVVIPPPGASPGLLDPALAALGERYNVLSWDPRCQAAPSRQSDGSTDAAAFDIHVADFHALLDHERWKPEDLFVVGYCAGAPIAMYFAATLQRTVTRLALVSGAYFIAPELAPQTQYERDLRRLVEQLVVGPEAAPALYRLCVERGCARGDAGTDAFELALRYPFRSAESLHAYASTLATLQRADVLSIAPGVVAPTLVFAAQSDCVAAPGAACMIAAALPCASLTLAPDGSHHDFPRAEAAVTEAVTRFFDERAIASEGTS